MDEYLISAEKNRDQKKNIGLDRVQLGNGIVIAIGEFIPNGVILGDSWVEQFTSHGGLEQ